MLNNGKISLVIPVKNEEKTIERLLKSIFQQTRKPDEIVITDGGSTDNTIEIIKSYIKKSYTIKLIEVDHAYPGKGRNLAVEASENDIIAFTDAGIKLDPCWLEKLMEPLQGQNQVDVVYGNYYPVTNTFFKECYDLAYVPPLKPVKGKLWRTKFIASSIMKKKVWEEVGGFPDYRAAEDRIFMENIDTAGFKVDYAPNANVYWDIPHNLRAVFRRFYSYSYHDILAGKAVDWHYAVSRMYFIGFFIIILAKIHSLWWLSVLLIAVLTRTIKKVVNKRQEMSSMKLLNPLRVVMVTIILFTMDMAMFMGLGKWIVKFIRRP